MAWWLMQEFMIKPDEQGYIMSSNYSEDVEMQDVEDDDDEEGEVDVELATNEGELIFFTVCITF